MSDTRKDEPEIQTADGSFYKHYKRGILDFLQFTSQTGTDAIASGKLQQEDLAAVESGLASLGRVNTNLFPLLAKRINERDPTFFDESTIETIWSALGAVFLIAQHSGFTDSAKVQAHLVQGEIARKAKAAIDDLGKQAQIEKIKSTPTYKASAGRRIKIVAVEKESGLSASTIRRRLKEMRQA